MKRLLTFLFIAVMACACGPRNGSVEEFRIAVYQPAHASGFEILGAEHRKSTLIRVNSPWQGEGAAPALLFVARDGEQAPEGFDGQVVEAGARNIICLSSTHVALLDALGEVERIKGVSGINYVSNDYITRNREKIADVGFDRNIDYELLVAQSPDLVLLYGVTGASVLEPKLKELGIPFFYVGEYLEESPLGKAEWVVAIAEVLDLREEGIRHFSAIPERYRALQQRADSLGTRPRVMLNTPYGGQWFMASTKSYVARLIADAGGDYIYTQNTSNRSQPIDLEEAYLLAAQADYWLNTGSITTMEELHRQLPKFSGLKCVKNGAVYNCTRRTSPAGSNDYWESGVMHPDVVLADLLKIFHPEVMEDYPEMYYYEKVE